MIGGNWRVSGPEICLAGTCAGINTFDVDEILFNLGNAVVSHVPSSSVFILGLIYRTVSVLTSFSIEEVVLGQTVGCGSDLFIATFGKECLLE